METTVRHACEADLPVIMELLVLKAEFDGCREALVATEEQLRQAFFSSTPKAQVLLAVIDGRAIGLATYFQTFSTYVGKPGIWLDDLYVREGYRSRGVGKALMAELARIAKGLGCGRIDWTVALSNERGIAFYERHGATVYHRTRCVRLGPAGIERLAEEVSQADTNDVQ
jgi:GNAT superfamily N-acetyltransferase